MDKEQIKNEKQLMVALADYMAEEDRKERSKAIKAGIARAKARKQALSGAKEMK